MPRSWSRAALAAALLLAGAAAARPAEPARYWLLGGTLQQDGAHFDPLFEDRAPMAPASQHGACHAWLRDSDGKLLWQGAFDPQPPPDADAGEAPRFAVAVPVLAGAAQLAVSGPDDVGLGVLRLDGAAPSVALLQPAGPGPLAGRQEVRWLVDNSAAPVAARVDYSADGGATWQRAADVAGADSVRLDFGRLPGSDGQALLRVQVSDGARSASVTSPVFSVPKKGPQDLLIVSPAPDSVADSAQPLRLEGSAFDAEDGVLQGTAISWHSSLDGPLGHGLLLSATLRPGRHVLTMTATDSDGNQASVRVALQVAGR